MRANIALASLLAGAAATPLVAQQAPPPPEPPAAQPSNQSTPPPRIMEFRGPDGKPLPPEIQAQLRERFKNGPPPPGEVVRIGPAGGEPPAGSQQDVVVNARRPRGSVIGDIPPERTFDPLDIRAYGANSIEELLQTLGPQLASDRGREDRGPVVLLNGKRVSSFAEIARIPTEAIERMEVFPEELALKYGYRADQKVVNVVVFERFTSRVGQLSYAIPTEGGRDTIGTAASYLRIRGETRYNFDADYSRSGKLLESERDIRQAAGAAELGRFRTLLPSTERFTLGGTVSGTVLSDVSATLNSRFEASASEGLFGIGANGPLTRDIDTRVAHIGTALSGRVGKWLWSATGNYDRTRTDTLTDSAGAATRDTARSVDARANADVLLSGPLLSVPAGSVSASVRGGVDLRDFRSRSLVAGVGRGADLSRDRGTIQANLDVPITGQATPALAWLGSLSANANLAVEQLSGFGTLSTVGYGLNWSPRRGLNLLASVTDEEGAPTVEQLGAPLIVTPNTRVFDFARRDAIDVTRIVGGNPALRSDDRRVFSLGLTAKPLAKTDLTISLDYVNTRIDDPIASFPILTPAIEAAFPERFVRAPSGRLLQIDGTPLNFARSDQQQLRMGISFSRPLGSLPPGLQAANIRFATSEAEARRRLPPGAQIMRVESGSPAARRYENLTSRLTFSVEHLWRLEDEVLLRPGTPVLDLLNGGALDARGGRSRHEIEVQAGAFKRGLGARVTADWQGGTTVRGNGAGDLDFGAYATVNIALFANVATYLGKARTPDWASGLRVSLAVNNLFDTRPDVRDQTGAVPLNYQPGYINPVGRLVSLNLRKVF